LVDLIEQADLRIAQHAPRHGGETRRDEEWQRDERFQRAAHRRVGSRENPGQQNRQHERGDGLGERYTDRVEQRHHTLQRENLEITIQIERARHTGRARMQAPVEQHRQRIDGEEGQKHHKNGDGNNSPCGRRLQQSPNPGQARRRGH
jgi:hypothetical protein